jgi:hypothetical protein
VVEVVRLGQLTTGEVKMKKVFMALLVMAGIGLTIAMIMRRRSGDESALPSIDV